MPLYRYKCEKCGLQQEVVQNIGGIPLFHCGKVMAKLPTFPAMIKWKGEGGLPSARKAHLGTAPFTNRYKGYAQDLKKT